ncbi:Hypothetical predicted protein [Pelobates cultripes]|uniref:Uncharacterized protein n=1 Tax=Pelobates cultripes TaxID=61616 RepID=A0AAD1W082_PELCU|nr:Hypothetical predicted protein [Pelobates cultripes]
MQRAPALSQRDRELPLLGYVVPVSGCNAVCDGSRTPYPGMQRAPALSQRDRELPLLGYVVPVSGSLGRQTELYTTGLRAGRITLRLIIRRMKFSKMRDFGGKML